MIKKQESAPHHKDSSMSKKGRLTMVGDSAPRASGGRGLVENRYHQAARGASDMIWGGVWGALGLLLPILLHPFGLGPYLMPIFLPLLIAGCTLHLRVSLVLAATLPLISSLLIGMPPLYPAALIMILEGALMMVWLSWSYRKRAHNIYFALAAALVIQRLAMLPYALISRELYVTILVGSLPGAVLQLILVPWVIELLKKGGYLPIACRPAGRCAGGHSMEEKKSYFDRLAPRWREAKKLDGNERELLRRSLSGLPLRDSDIVLDLGGGAGRLSDYLIEEHSLRPLVLDFSLAMLKEGWASLDHQALGWVQAPAHLLPLRDGSVAHIFCFSAFPHFDSRREVLAECRRVLRPGGSFLLLHACSREEIDRFHHRVGGPVAADRLPSPAEFRKWGKYLVWEIEKVDDSADRFVVHFRKPD